MKNEKLLIGIIAGIMGLALIIGCVFGGIYLFGDNGNSGGETPTINGETQGADIQSAIDYLKNTYKDDGAVTPADYTRLNLIRIAGAPYQIVWTADVAEDLVKITDNGNGTCRITVSKECAEETPYTLTATVSNGKKEVSHSWNYKLPSKKEMAEKMHAIVDAAYELKAGEAMEGNQTLTGKVISIDQAYREDYNNITVTIQIEGREDKPIKCYRMKGEGVEVLKVGDEITVTGILKNYNGTIEFDQDCTMAPLAGYVPPATQNGGSTTGTKNDNNSNKTTKNPNGGNKTTEKPSVTLKLVKDESKILKDAFELGRNETTPYIAQLTGKVFTIDTPYDDQYGSITVTITVGGKKIKCYQMKGDGTDKVKVGDTITVKGVIKNFYYEDSDKGTVEFAWHAESATEVTMISRKAADKVDLSTPAKIIAAALKLERDEALPQEVTLTGKVVSIAEAYDAGFDNISVFFTVNGTTLKCYRMTGTGVSSIKAGDTITVKGTIMNYSGNLQFGQGCVMTKRTAGTASGPETDQAKILSEAFALDPGAMLPYQARLTGKIVSVDTEYSSQYDNVTVTIEVGGKKLKCYRLKGGKDLGVGDTITVTGIIKNYVHSSGDSEIEFDQGCTFTKG